MLKNKQSNIILALIIAIALWLYVVGDVNPETKVTVKDIPIEFTHVNELESEGLTVLRSSVSEVDVRVSGPRSTVTRLKQNDFKVTADVEALDYGENTVRLSVEGPDNVKIENIGTEKIIVVVDKRITAAKDIVVVYDGEAGNDKEPYIVEMSQKSINVTGAKSVVDKVINVKATVEMSQIEGTMKTLNAKLVAVDADGKEIENVKLDRKTINVAAIMLQKKTVALEVPVINLSSDDYDRQIEIPKTIAIKGDEAALADIESVTCETLDLANVTENTVIELKPILPRGVEVSTDSAKLEAKVTVKGLGSQVYEFDGEDIELLNKTDGLMYQIEDVNIGITVAGKSEDLRNTTAADIKLSADVEGLSKGTHTVALKVECSKTVNSVTSSVKEVKITIK